MHMGPGFLPTALGIILVIIGIAIAAVPPRRLRTAPIEDQRILPENPQWWAWFCILMSPVLFIFFGSYFGMIPGTFACVFIAALGDKNATWKSTIHPRHRRHRIRRRPVLVFPAGSDADSHVEGRPVIDTALTDLWYGFGVALEPHNLMWCFVGVLVGNMVGVLPGMGPLATISILLPLTFGMKPVAAILMLARRHVRRASTAARSARSCSICHAIRRTR